MIFENLCGLFLVPFFFPASEVSLFLLNLIPGLLPTTGTVTGFSPVFAFPASLALSSLYISILGPFSLEGNDPLTTHFLKLLSSLG